MNIEISFVITVYNKSNLIVNTIKSITREYDLYKDLGITCEYIFVDDASEDNSVETIVNLFNTDKKLSNIPYTIIRNQENKGPSIRLNQGCQVARGKYLFLMDADDILAKSALQKTYYAIINEKADFLFGFQKKTNNTQEELLEIFIPEDIGYSVTTHPMNTILNGKYTRMSYLVSADLYKKSSGADERIFIQDQSLPLRLGYHSEKLISMSIPIIYAPEKPKTSINSNAQQLHDSFFANYYAITEFTKLTEVDKSKIYLKLISSVWKVKKHFASNLDKFLFLCFYLYAKLYPSLLKPKIKLLKKYKQYIESLENVRKTI